jgi:hypothetical protein
MRHYILGIHSAASVLAAALLLMSAFANAKPTIFWVSDPVQPGEAVMVIGDNLDADAKIEIREIGSRAKRGAPWSTIPPLQADNQAIKFALPAGGALRPYELRITAGDGAATATVNTPTIYWHQADEGAKATPGGWVRIFGRCIAASGSAELKLLAADGKLLTIQSRQADMWSASFDIPARIEAGTHKIVLRSSGVETAVSEDLQLISSAPDTKLLPRYEVTAFGATGGGTEDDWPAVQLAIKAAHKYNRAQVFFPRGRYRLSGVVSVPDGVDLVGAAADSVNIFWSDSDNPPDVLLRLSAHSRLSDLTLYASRYKALISNAFEPVRDRGDVTIENVVIRGNPYMGHLSPEEVDRRFRQTGGALGDALRLAGSNIKIINVDVLSAVRSLAFHSVRNAVVRNSHFRNGRRGWYSLSGVDGIIFENNEVSGADLMASGGGINTLDGSYSSQNVYARKNTFRMMQGWDREALTSDGGTGLFYGVVKSPAPNAIRLDKWVEGNEDDQGRWVGAGVFVLGGRGRGQFARVLSREGDSVIIDRAWIVRPDSTSLVTIVPMQQNFLLLDNTFEDTGVGIQFYGTSLNHVVAGNTSRRTGGFYASGRWYKHYQPSWYCQFLDNVIEEGAFYRGGANNGIESGEAVIGVYGLQRAPNIAPLAMGAVLRRNRIANNGQFVVMGGTSAAPGVRDVIFEGNILQHSVHGLQLDDGVAGLLQRENSLSQ